MLSKRTKCSIIIEWYFTDEQVPDILISWNRLLDGGLCQNIESSNRLKFIKKINIDIGKLAPENHGFCFDKFRNKIRIKESILRLIYEHGQNPKCIKKLIRTITPFVKDYWLLHQLHKDYYKLHHLIRNTTIWEIP